MKEMTFEEALKELEKIVKAIDEGEVSLEDSLSLFEEGVQLIKYLNTCLDNAKLKIVDLKSEINEVVEENE